MDSYELERLAEDIRFESMAYAGISDERVTGLPEYRQFVSQLGVDMSQADPYGAPAYRALRLAVNSGLVDIIPRRKFDAATLLQLEKVIRSAGSYPSKGDLLLARLLRPLSLVVPLIACYLVISSGYGWGWALGVAACSLYLLTSQYQKCATRVVMRTVAESKTLFQYLWQNRQIALYDLSSGEVKDTATTDHWPTALDMIISAQ